MEPQSPWKVRSIALLVRQCDRLAKLAADVADVVLLVERDDVAGDVDGSELVVELHLVEVVGRQVESLPAESADRPDFEGQPEETVAQLAFQVERDHLAVGPRSCMKPSR